MRFTAARLVNESSFQQLLAGIAAGTAGAGPVAMHALKQHVVQLQHG